MRKYATKVSFLIVTVMTILVSGMAVPQVVEAACQSPAIVFGRWKWCGYFYNNFQDSGENVRIGGVPGSVNNIGDFINLLEDDIDTSPGNRKTAAIFVIRTMVGAPMAPLPSPPQADRSTKQPNNSSHAIVAEWRERLRGYANISENGTVSRGQNGTISWFVSQHTPCGMGNTYWQPAHNDVAAYTDDPSNSDCEVPSARSDFIIVRNNSGVIQYMIRRQCMNPMGTLRALDDTPISNYNLTPNVGAAITSGGAPVAGTTAEPGDSVTFTYRVTNSGPTSAANIQCRTYANTHTGSFTAPNPATSSGPAGPGTGCPRTFNPGNTQIATETVNNLPANRTVCRSLWVNPAHSGAGSEGREVCVRVASKPYMRVYGGDVSAGNGFSSGATATTCTNNAGAAIVGWNRESAGAFAGAGAQFGVMALNRIFDFASAQGNAGGAPAGSGLAFSNASASGGTFGGNFGSLPCIPDLYAKRPATSAFGPNLTAMGSGAYAANGPLTINGNINGNERISLFVNGNVIIDGNITYSGGAWATPNDIPLFQLVATGNIYIVGSVTQLDGLYVAQGSGGNNGIIYTCTSGATPVATNALGSNCGSKLTVNGSFIARSVQFMRSAGTLARSTAAETAAGGQGAEVFNYSPIMWLTVPYGQSETTDYDAITSLPPIL